MRRALAALSVTSALLTLASDVPFAQSANQSPSLMADQLDVVRIFAISRTAITSPTVSRRLRPSRHQGRSNGCGTPAIRVSRSITSKVTRAFGGVIFPENEYDTDPVLPFSIQFVTPRTVRIQSRPAPVRGGRNHL